MPKLDSLSNVLLTMFDLLLDVLRFIRVSLRPLCALAAENLWVAKIPSATNRALLATHWMRNSTGISLITFLAQWLLRVLIERGERIASD